MKFIRGNRNKSCIGTFLFLLSFLFSLQALSAKVEDSITTSGVLFQDEVWSGQVHVTGDVVIPEGITLTVRAGTTITFLPNSIDILIQHYSNPTEMGNIFENNEVRVDIKG